MNLPLEQPTIAPSSPPPAHEWGPDVLGPGFVARSLPLIEDDEGPVDATLVAYLPHQDPSAIAPAPAPSFVLLYLHGWNDYFYQRELARHISAAGGAFYALDLRKYGRSLREYQTFGFTTNLRTYDEDIRAAWTQIHQQHPHLPQVLMGHSTGGLIATQWAARHRGALKGLILNSPWLELLEDPTQRTLTRPVIEAFAARSPKTIVPLGSDDRYGQTLDGWHDEDGPLPPQLEPWREDPSVSGWRYIPGWKSRPSAPIRPAFLKAVIDSQTFIAQGVDVECPVLLLASTSSPESTKEWDITFRQQDTVLNADAMVRAGCLLSEQVTIVRLPGKHDLVLSDPPVRQELWYRLHYWLADNVVYDRTRLNALSHAELTRICP